MGRAQQVLGDHQVRQNEQVEQLRCVLSEPFVAHLAMVEQILDDMKRMLDPRANLRLGSLDLDQQILQRSFAHRLDLAALDGYVPLHRLALHLIAFVHARVSSVAEGFALVAGAWPPVYSPSKYLYVYTGSEIEFVMPHRAPLTAARLAEIYDEQPTPVVLELL